MIFDNYNKAKVIKQYVLDTTGASYFEEDDVLQSGNSVGNLNPVFIRRGRDEKVVYQVDAFLLLRRSAEGSSQITERVELIPGYKTVTYA
jgi:hypothetical protein